MIRISFTQCTYVYDGITNLTIFKLLYTSHVMLILEQIQIL